MATWRDHPQAHSGLLYIDSPLVIFAAQVHGKTLSQDGRNYYDSSLWRYIYYETVTAGAAANCTDGMMICLGTAAGGFDLGRARVKGYVASANGSPAIQVHASEGILDGELTPIDGAYITVYDLPFLWAKPPYINSYGYIFKDGDQDTPFQRPVANGGPHYLGRINPLTGVVSLTFRGSEAIATADGATISTHLWDMDGGTITSGTTASANPVASFSPGRYIVTHTVTDSNGKTHTRRILVVAVGDDYTAELDYTGATATESSKTFVSFGADKLIDNDDATYWASNTTTDSWAEITLASAQPIYGFRYKTIQAEERVPKDFSLSIDGTTVYTVTGLTGSYSLPFFHAFSTPITGQVVRLTIATTRGNYAPILYELDLLDEPTTYNPQIENFTVSSPEQSFSGQRMTFQIYDDLPVATYPNSTMVLYAEDEYFNGVKGSLSGPTGWEHMKFVGWIDREPVRISANDLDAEFVTELECVDLAGRLASIFAKNDLIERKASASDWMLMAKANRDRIMHHILDWHSNALELADFTWSGTGETYALPSNEIPQASNLWEQVDALAGSFAHILTIDRWGRLWVKPDPQLWPVDTPTTELISYDYSNRTKEIWLNGPSGAGGTTTVDNAGATVVVVGTNGGNVYSQSQSLQVTAGLLSQITITLGANGGTPTGLLAWVLCTTSPTGTPVIGGTFTPTPSALNTINISANRPYLQAGTDYYLTVTAYTTQTNGNYFTWLKNGTNPYANGQRYVGTNGTYAAASGDDMRCAVTTVAIATKEEIAQSIPAVWISGSHFLPDGNVDVGYDVKEVKLWLLKVGTPTDQLTVTYHYDSGGDPAATVEATSEVVYTEDLPTAFTNVSPAPTTFVFATPINVVLGGWLKLQTNGAQSNTDYVALSIDDSPGYTGGVLKSYDGATWNAESADACFQVFVEYGAVRTTTSQETLTEDDIGDIQYTYSRTPRLHWSWGSAVRANTLDKDDPDLVYSALFCVAPGTAPGQGAGESTYGEQLVTCDGELRARTALRYARENAPIGEVNITLVHTNDGDIDLSQLEWVTLNLSVAYAAQRGLPLTFKVLPLAITQTHEEGGVKTAVLRAEAEVFAGGATSYDPPS